MKLRSLREDGNKTVARIDRGNQGRSRMHRFASLPENTSRE
jgi:hypothetical protein